ncbi:MAG TPA: hypothetical protein PLO14_11355 [Accumulibacter sp.]|uniref:hypothetical protein n=1 Tax=Accumulibacter sp. TaxID=2053492 RepID=UPI0025CCF667|nr:hypothetical protein [Accumulibacter sp.]MCM8597267.1 hypothetical protein [Accumulibacter sp.]MCM8661491.1 hypothetical protein [Accumulibacter sp.]HNC52819.1 hypothetical protein [Accumulibacter sp.]
MRRRHERIALLGRELELLMGERQTLLQIVGATAALIASLDGRLLPMTAVRPADLVSSTLNALPDETLRDALAAVRAEIDEEAPFVSG